MAGKSFLSRKFNNDGYYRLARWIVLANLVYCLAYYFLSTPRMMESVGVFRMISWTWFDTSEGLAGRALWTILTYPFVVTSLISLLFHSIFLYFFGNRYEMEIGSKEFLFLYFSASIFAGLMSLFLSAVTGMDLILAGPAASTMALLTVYSMLHRYEMIIVLFFLPMRLPLAVMLFLALDILFLYFGMGSISGAALSLFGFAYALLYAKFRIRISLRQFFSNLF